MQISGKKATSDYTAVNPQHNGTESKFLRCPSQDLDNNEITKVITTIKCKLQSRLID